jgi:hypothetical protein
MLRLLSFIAFLLLFTPVLADEPKLTGRRPSSDTDLRYWLQNLARHRFSEEEKQAALALSPEQLKEAYQRLKLKPEDRLASPREGIEILPYPGGRHPRIGFLDGAIDPQRETKVTAFTPWDRESYVVIDVPEALWSNLGLTYLAHTHIDTIWTKAKIELDPLEWKRRDDGHLALERQLPNGIIYKAEVAALEDGVQMSLALTNGTKEKLSDLRVQNCVMLKGAKGFEKQTNDNKRFLSPFAVAISADGKHHILTAWERCDRAWGNAPCPCLHSDPKFPDLAPGESAEIKGRLWFYAGDDVEQEMTRLKKQFDAK